MCSPAGVPLARGLPRGTRMRDRKCHSCQILLQPVRVRVSMTATTPLGRSYHHPQSMLEASCLWSSERKIEEGTRAGLSGRSPPPPSITTMPVKSYAVIFHCNRLSLAFLSKESIPIVFLSFIIMVLLRRCGNRR